MAHEAMTEEILLQQLCNTYGVNIEQGKALDITKNTALRAGAGSGKTRVLTKRFVRMLIKNQSTQLEELVAITFTKKAATEMKDRIRKELGHWINEETSEQGKQRLRNFQKKLSHANIDTIHGFCGKLIRENYLFLGLDPDFDVIEEVDQQVILEKIAKQAIFDLTCASSPMYPYGKVFVKAFGYDYLLNDVATEAIQLYKKAMESNYLISEISWEGSSDYKTWLKAVLLEIDARYTDEKTRHEVVDFNDLERMTLALLKQPEIQAAYHKRFKTVMVDEFQDVNPLQLELIILLVEEQGQIPPGKLFIVGDTKQSIYGFRGSDYRVFEAMCQRIGQQGILTQLNQCYRSTKEMIEGINGIFKHLLDAYEPLYYPNHKVTHPYAPIQVIYWDKESVGSTELSEGDKRWQATKDLLKNDEDADKLQSALMADYCDSNQINQPTRSDYQGKLVLNSVIQLAQEIDYKDIAILLRSRKSLPAIEERLLAAGIPYCVIGGLGFWQRLEVKDLLVLYQLIFEEDHRLALLTVMKSPLFRIQDTEITRYVLFEKAHGSEYQTLIQKLQGFIQIQKQNEEITTAFEKMVTILGQLLPLEEVYSASRMMEAIIEATAYESLLLSEQHGEKKLRNVEKLLQIVKGFDAKELYPSNQLLAYLAEMEKSNAMQSEAFLDNEDSEAVKIMTIHGSKGLEFEGVILPDLHASVDYLTLRKSPDMLLQGTKLIFSKEEADKEAYKEQKSHLAMKAVEESERLFYVATTRAKSRLILIGEDDSDKKSDQLNTMGKQLRYAADASQGSLPYVEWITAEEWLKQELPSKQQTTLSKQVTKRNNTYTHLLESIHTPVTGNMSISSWMKYRECPKKYLLENIVYLRQKEATEEMILQEPHFSAAQFGTLFHGFLEKEPLFDWQPQMTKRRFDTFLDKNVLDQASHAEFYKALQGYIQAESFYRTTQKDRQLIQVIPEFSFQVPIYPGFHLQGFVDRLDIYQSVEGIEVDIIDYKTNKIHSQEALHKKSRYYAEQLLAYSWAIENIPLWQGNKVKVTGLWLFFLDPGQAMQVTIDEVEKADLIQKLAENASGLLGMEKAEWYKACKGDWCEYCESGEWCEV